MLCTALHDPYHASIKSFRIGVDGEIKKTKEREKKSTAREK